MTSKQKLDLSLYLVTDSTASILGDRDLTQVVDEALRGGVTIVQYRDKHADTGHMIQVAKQLHVVTQKHRVPLLINDRIDVALAVDAEGVHLGQDDMDIALARRLLPPNSIVGATASSVQEARKAINDGADYLGIGTVFATTTKEDTKSIIGTRGVQTILRACKTGTAHSVGCVAIGSINAGTLQRVLHQSAHLSNHLNGVAVVSAIMASQSPQAAARQLKELLRSADSHFYPAIAPGVSSSTHIPEMLKKIPALIRKHATSSTLCHNMTNTVVQNFAANVCLATGSSPIMSLNGEEAVDLAQLGGALVINMGTVTPDILSIYQAGIRAYNAAGNPVLFDPVGGGATSVRKAAIQTLMESGFFDIIKGNEGEIMAVAGSSQVQQRGVDSGPSSSTPEQKADLVKQLAQRERCVVLMSGAVDYLSDGSRTIAISNGSHWLGCITGSGCALGSVIASYVAVHREDKFLATLAAIMHYELAAEQAERSASCKGPGTFIPAFLDELYLLRDAVTSNGKVAVEERAKLAWM